MSVVLHRRMVDTDRNFIRATWLRSFKNSHFAGLLDDEVYFRVYHDLIDGLIDKPEVEVWCAAYTDDPDDLFGYLVVDRSYVRPTVHWAYVKDAYRRKGVLRSLLAKVELAPDAEFFYTFRNSDAARLCRPGGFCPVAVHEPRLIRRRGWDGSRALSRFPRVPTVEHR